MKVCLGFKTYIENSSERLQMLSSGEGVSLDSISGEISEGQLIAKKTLIDYAKKRLLSNGEEECRTKSDLNETDDEKNGLKTKQKR